MIFAMISAMTRPKIIFAIVAAAALGGAVAIGLHEDGNGTTPHGVFPTGSAVTITVDHGKSIAPPTPPAPEMPKAPQSAPLPKMPPPPISPPAPKLPSSP
jgi:hypothetical protein